MENIYTKPNNFMELLELQRVLDDKTSAQRPNGFKPRARTERDIRFALDDEFNEFMKELPDELNFKTWKQKEWSAEKQLIEFVDCLFFIAAAINYFYPGISIEKKWLYDIFDDYKTHYYNSKSLEAFIEFFKEELNSSISLTCYDGLDELLTNYITLSNKLGYTKNDLLETYWKNGT